MTMMKNLKTGQVIDGTLNVFDNSIDDKPFVVQDRHRSAFGYQIWQYHTMLEMANEWERLDVVEGKK